ncbi:MAG: metallophosphoesterase [Planctomycetes bacterium]|nr:metallophosphoesterase [Planctomycetota bacterium]
MHRLSGPVRPIRRPMFSRARILLAGSRRAKAAQAHFTELGPDDPEVIGAFPHIPDAMLRTARVSWRALAAMMRPQGRRMVARQIARAGLPHLDIPLEGLPSAFDGYKIAFLSDIHAGPYLGSEILKPLFQRVSAEKPDLVVLGGDLVNYDADEAAEVAHSLKYLHAKDGILSVPGNHDHYSGDLRRIIKYLEHGGAQTLLNDATSVVRGREHVNFLGVDDGGAGRFDLARARSRARDSKINILLSHTPDALPLAARAKIDLMLSGHTHGGQIRAPRIRPISTHTKGRYVDGFYRSDRTLAFVGRGVGVVCIPMRAFCPPHAPILVLRRAT